jgi:biotin carboxyl carrier protein
MGKKKENQVLSEERIKTFIIDEEKYKTLLTKKYLNRKPWKPTEPSHVTSFIPGVVTKVFVTEGQYVEENDKLIILEAMKMKNIITVPYSGIIKSIHVKEGQSIPKGHLIAEIDIQIKQDN